MANHLLTKLNLSKMLWQDSLIFHFPLSRDMRENTEILQGLWKSGVGKHQCVTKGFVQSQKTVVNRIGS